MKNVKIFWRKKINLSGNSRKKYLEKGGVLIWKKGMGLPSGERTFWKIGSWRQNQEINGEFPTLCTEVNKSVNTIGVA